MGEKGIILLNKETFERSVRVWKNWRQSPRLHRLSISTEITSLCRDPSLDPRVLSFLRRMLDEMPENAKCISSSMRSKSDRAVGSRGLLPSPSHVYLETEEDQLQKALVIGYENFIVLGTSCLDFECTKGEWRHRSYTGVHWQGEKT